MYVIRILLNITIRNDIHKSFMDFYYTILQFRSLIGEEPKFRDISRRVSSRIIITKFRWKNRGLLRDG